jgi:hypothetical protein
MSWSRTWFDSVVNGERLLIPPADCLLVPVLKENRPSLPLERLWFNASAYLFGVKSVVAELPESMIELLSLPRGVCLTGLWLLR